MLVIYVIVSLLVLLMLLGAAARVGRKRTTITTTATGWQQIREKWYPLISMVMVLVAWYLVGPASFRKAVPTAKFMVGGGLLVGAYFVVGTHKPFKESGLRWVLNTGMVLAGLALVASAVTGAVGYHITPAQWTTPPTSLYPPPSSPKRVIRVEVSPDKDTGWITIPPGPFTFKSTGKISFIFPNGEVRTVEDGEDKWLGEIPSNRFKLRGRAGTVTLTSTSS